MGKSPLRLITKRTWHTSDSFTDNLECGHESSLQFLDFAGTKSVTCNELQPTAKCRRCQACKETQCGQQTKKAQSHFGTGAGMGVIQKAGSLSRDIAVSGRNIPAPRKKTQRVESAANATDYGLANLYTTAQDFLNAPPKKSAISVKPLRERTLS